MKIGLIDVDGHNFPNLALMRISAWHKSQGDVVEWWWSDLTHYDIVYMSKVFSGTYTKDKPEPLNADRVIKGGTGYAISTIDGREVYDKSKDPDLPPEIEAMPPDYSIYPQYAFAISMTSRGCPRGCPFCHVAAKEGRCSRKVAEVSDFWRGQKKIEIIDPNISACPDKRQLFRDYAATGARLKFNQGLDIRLTSDEDIADLNRMRLESLHFAWDNPNDDLYGRFRNFSEKFTASKRNPTEVFCLTNYEPGLTAKEHLDRALARIYPLRELGYNPYVMVYDKPNAPRELRLLQRWCNNKYIFRSCERFEDYDPKRG